MMEEGNPRLHGALDQELKTVQAMLKIYCKAHHPLNYQQCTLCAELERYARMRLDRCPYGQNKPTCNQCPIHCYKPEFKQRMRDVMRYAGPRMLVTHPILALRHLINERKSVDKKPLKGESNYHARKNKKGR